MAERLRVAMLGMGVNSLIHSEWGDRFVDYSKGTMRNAPPPAR